jgi:hypothetical protein
MRITRKITALGAAGFMAVGGGAALAACGGGTPDATQVVQDDGFHVLHVPGVGGHLGDPADISSAAAGSQGDISSGNASIELVIVLTSNGQGKEGKVVQAFQQNTVGSGLSISKSGDVIRVTGPEASWTQFSNGGF